MPIKLAWLYMMRETPHTIAPTAGPSWIKTILLMTQGITLAIFLSVISINPRILGYRLTLFIIKRGNMFVEFFNKWRELSALYQVPYQEGMRALFAAYPLETIIFFVAVAAAGILLCLIFILITKWIGR
ncbi:MAG: hypothetical protein WC454_09210 [Phycisphaerae bacterium]